MGIVLIGTGVAAFALFGWWGVVAWAGLWMAFVALGIASGY